MPLPHPVAEENIETLQEQIHALSAALAEQEARCIRLESGIRVAAGREQERLAQKLHDTVSQNLSGMHLMAVVITRKYAETCPAASAEIAELGETILTSAEEMHSLICSLRVPPPEGNTASP